jgi:hypothetical protein
VRHALGLAVDVRTSAVVRPAQPEPVRADEAALAALVRAMRTASDAGLRTGHQALARELVWCALAAARENRVGQVVDAARTLRLLAVASIDGAPSDRIDHG